MSLLEDYVVLDTQGPRTSQDWLNLLQRQEAMHNKVKIAKVPGVVRGILETRKKNLILK